MPVTATSAAGDGTGAAPTTQVGRARPCYGNPPRQTPDPQSPSCLPTMFEGDNGGTTATGVSATEIRVALPITETDTTNGTVFRALVEYVNRHYELYGRRLVPVYTGAPATANPVDARAAAASIAGAGVFATLPPVIYESAFFQELARGHVVTVANSNGFLLDDRTMLDPLHPYLWSVNPSLEELSRNIADFSCTALADRPARFAGGDLRTATRKFGIIATGATAVPSTAALVQAFDACGVRPRVVSIPGSPVNATTPEHRTALQAFKDDGITTIVCLCHTNLATWMNRDAAALIGYRPEWLPMTHTVVDEFFANSFAKGAPEFFQIIQVKPIEKVMPMQARPSFGALLEVAPSLSDPMKQHYIAQRFYTQLVILAAGIQAAGPTLTPDTFGQGLMALQFPNTSAGAAPHWQGGVGFGAGDHGYFSDFTIAWWDMRMPVYDTAAPAGSGSWCYYGQGARFRVGTYPANATDRFFQPDELCR